MPRPAGTRQPPSNPAPSSTTHRRKAKETDNELPKHKLNGDRCQGRHARSSEHLPDIWEEHVEEISPDALAPLQGKNDWRSGRVTSGVGDVFAVRTDRSGKGAVGLRQVGDCAPPGGWIAMLHDVTLLAWCRAKMGGNLRDDGELAYPRALFAMMGVGNLNLRLRHIC
ncbi:hypothetical protein DFJ73DRAFT_762294 [Zopfochytrium polystomum]|nr:hypothetical protein DFJ73DRAFT_762294 [Zopfochytrium polystomum]